MRDSVACRAGGFTLVELLLAIGIVAVVFAGSMAAYVGQRWQSANARSLQRAMNDAVQILETMRQNNVDCALPTAAPSGYQTWDAWLRAQPSGKGLGDYESIALTCQNAEGTDYCGPNQVGSDGWNRKDVDTDFSLIHVSVAVGYMVFGHVVGGTASGPEFTAALIGNGVQYFYGFPDRNANRVIDAQAMLTTDLACR